jgi:predicted anti-sigma-YlaC factor YlaD
MISWLKGLMFRHMHGMLTCREFDSFVLAYLDGELSSRQRSVFEWHLRLCRECRDYLAAYKRTLEIGQAIMQSPEASLPQSVPEDLITAILEARQQS